MLSSTTDAAYSFQFATRPRDALWWLMNATDRRNNVDTLPAAAASHKYRRERQHVTSCEDDCY